MRRDRGVLGVALVSLALAALSACAGGDGDENAFTPIKGTESAYCDTFRAWQVHELAGEGEDQLTRAALEKYWGEYLAFNKKALAQSPAVIRDEWEVSERGVRAIPTRVLQKYDFDNKRIAREATPAEQEALSEPPPEVKKAQDAIHAYEAKTCGTESPPAADVTFKADASSKRYCQALGTLNDGLGQVESSRFDPKVMRQVVTSQTFSNALDAQDKSAPDEIAADVKTVTEWFRTRWSDVVEEFQYDIRRIWLDGTPEDRAVFHLAHPDVAEHDARLTAYEEQVCS